MKRRIAVVFGGVSMEREVSIVSARTILSGLPSQRYDAFPVAIDPDGSFRNELDSRAILDRGFSAVGSAHRRLHAEAFSSVDVVFPIVHGETGEDGTIQGFLEMMGIPYVGSDVSSSALGMNKAAFKARMREAGLPVVRSLAVIRSAWEAGAAKFADEVARRFSLPIFVKPSGSGSSVGVAKVKTWEDLAGAVEAAFAYDGTVLAEEGIDAREIECAILGDEDPRASGCGEIVPGREFYNYEDKYITGGARLLVPAPLEAPQAEEIRAMALTAFRICGCSGLARVDFFLDRQTGRIYLSELNTIPGFTSISMYPLLWAREGMPLPRLLDELVRLAFVRHERLRDAASRRPPPPAIP